MKFKVVDMLVLTVGFRDVSPLPSYIGTSTYVLSKSMSAVLSEDKHPSQDKVRSLLTKFDTLLADLSRTRGIQTCLHLRADEDPEALRLTLRQCMPQSHHRGAVEVVLQDAEAHAML